MHVIQHFLPKWNEIEIKWPSFNHFPNNRVQVAFNCNISHSFVRTQSTCTHKSLLHALFIANELTNVHNLLLFIVFRIIMMLMMMGCCDEKENEQERKINGSGFYHKNEQLSFVVYVDSIALALSIHSISIALVGTDERSKSFQCEGKSHHDFFKALISAYLKAFPIGYLQVVEDWKFVSMVLDRFFLWVFFLMCVGGTLGIIFESPSLYGKSFFLLSYQKLIEIISTDNREPIDKLLTTKTLTFHLPPTPDPTEEILKVTFE